ISPYEDNLYSEGFVVEFTRANGEKWVANFAKSWTDLFIVFEWTNRERWLIISGGIAYLMSFDSKKPLRIFGVDIREALQNETGILICYNGIIFNVVYRHNTL